MLTTLMLFAFVTVALSVWALTSVQAGSAERSRVLRYANTPVLTNEAPTKPQTRLPKTWEAFLARAGLEWSAQKAVMTAVGAALAGFVAFSFVGLGPLGLPVGLAGLYGWLRFQQGGRTRKMAAQLPDALMLMANAIKSGLGFQQALQLVSEEGAAPLAPEFARLGQDLALGLPIDEALMRLQTRLGSIDGEILASALLVQRQTGGNLSEILTNLHNTIRDRQNVAGQVRTLTAQGRLSGIVLTLIPVFIGGALWTLNKPYLMVLATDPRGQVLSGVAIGLMLMGVLWIRKIVDIKM